MQWGQPYTPYEPDFRHDLYDGDHMITSPTVIFNNQDVITHGFGQNIQLTDFDVVQNLQQNGASVSDRTYTLSQLQDMGLSAPGQFGDHAIGTNLYLNQGGVGVSSQLGAGTAAYVFGSIRFQMSEDTTFVIENGQLVSVDGSIELQPDNFNHESSTLPDWVSAIVAVGAGDTVNFDEVVILYEGEGADRTISRIIPESEYCFGAGTPIDMWPIDPTLKPGPDGVYDQEKVRAGIWKKPIEDIAASDVVVSFNKQGHLVPGEVTRTMTNNAKIILDFHGTFVTPGHVYWCAGGKFEGKYAPLIDILRDDGVIQHQDGTLIRASTGCEVGTPDDEEFYVFKVYTDAQGNERVRDRTKLRYGTRWMKDNGEHFTMREYMEGIGVEIIQDGPRKGYARWIESGMTMPFAWVLSETLPKPEDFVLARSATSLEDIYKAGQWEFMRPQMPAPMVMDGGPIQPLPEHKLEMMPRNEPMAFTSAAPSSEMLPGRKPTVNRKARKSAEARARLDAKNKRRKGETLH